jgi:hypothetical protein
MLRIDLRNAIEDKRVDNFTCLLFRLILKADSENRAQLAKGYPVQVEMANIFQKECPYRESPANPGTASEPDWEAIEKMAGERVLIRAQQEYGRM